MDGYNRYQKREARPNQKIYISNLAMDTTEEILRKSFDTFGAISDVSIKHKDNGIVFAFIEYESTKDAEKAVEEMNGKDLLSKELKVEFARGQNKFGGDRGGFRGDRGRGGRDDRRPRDGGDRPRGCFNCGEEGHFARDCTNPRKQREFNRDQDRGGYRNNRDFRGGSDRRDRDRDTRRKEESNSGSRSRSRSNDKKKRNKKRDDY